MDHQKYRQILEKTIVPAGLSSEETASRYKEVNDYIESFLPRKLYRFRRCNERNIDAFYYDKLWFSSGIMMNDDYDARLYYDRGQLQTWLDSLRTSDGVLRVLGDIFSHNGLPSEMEQMIPGITTFIDSLKLLPKENIIKISELLVHMLAENMDNELKRNTEWVQRMSKFACFSERIDSAMMWGQYSDCSTGFAVEYDIRDSITTYDIPEEPTLKIWTKLMPVSYSKRRMDGTDYSKYLFQIRVLRTIAQIRGMVIPELIEYIMVPCPDEFMTTKLAIAKSDEWKNEKEWRMFYISESRTEGICNYSYVIQKPSAVYLGRKISDINRKIIVDIARDKEIPIYHMELNDSDNRYKLRIIKR